MFSVVSVCLSIHKIPNWTGSPAPHPNMGPHSTGIPPPASEIWWSSLKTCLNVFIWGPPQVLTSGGYWSIYVRHKWAVLIHHTGMLSCTSTVKALALQHLVQTFVPTAREGNVFRDVCHCLFTIGLTATRSLLILLECFLVPYVQLVCRPFQTLCWRAVASRLSLIYMSAHKPSAGRWHKATYGCLVSGHLPQPFKKAHSKHTLHYHDYQLLDHLYIPPRILQQKAHVNANSTVYFFALRIFCENNIKSSVRTTLNLLW